MGHFLLELRNERNEQRLGLVVEYTRCENLILMGAQVMSSATFDFSTIGLDLILLCVSDVCARDGFKARRLASFGMDVAVICDDGCHG